MWPSIDGQKAVSNLVIENNDAMDNHICICVDVHFTCKNT